MFLSTLFISILALAGNNQQDFLPKGDCDQVVNHSFYSLCYSYEHRQALWTTHLLTTESIKGKIKRKNNFREDPELHDPVGENDYRGNGYDRGHLVPAGDMKYSKVSMSETFFMSNISPQAGPFNKGIWNNLENQVRNIVLKEGDAHVITAPVLEVNLKKTKHDISVPKWYYKILYIPGQQKMLAYLMPNKDLSGHDIEEYRVSVDEIEELTGLDFFSELKDSLENQLEAS